MISGPLEEIQLAQILPQSTLEEARSSEMAVSPARNFLADDSG